MALNMRKVAAQSAENNQKIYKKDNFYTISLEIAFVHVQTLYNLYLLQILFIFIFRVN
ncbi:IS1272 transposase [Mammaliicoccus lentus]|nr:MULTISPECIES: transposase [Staphylococcaceae]SCT97169.1 IS1272 transposase [Mammaliicoccus lentus]